MRMNSAVLTSAIVSRLYPLFRNEPPEDEANNSDYFLITLSRVIAEEVVSHIQQYARAIGQDTGGDQHDLNIV